MSPVSYSTVKNFRSVILSIIESECASVKNEDLYLDIDRNKEEFESVITDRHEDVLIVCQYYTQNRELMRNPEVKFLIDGDEWTPIAYGVDSIGGYEDRKHGVDLDYLLEKWAINLREQYLL